MNMKAGPNISFPLRLILLVAIVALPLFGNGKSTHAQYPTIDRTAVYIIASALTDPAGGSAGAPSPNQSVSPLFEPLIIAAEGAVEENTIILTVPDMDPTSSGPRAGIQEGIAAGAAVTVLFSQRAGLKNPAEAGSISLDVATNPPNGPANNIDLQISPTTPGAAASYRISFVPTADLPANSGEIVIHLDEDVQLPGGVTNSGGETPYADLSIVRNNLPNSATAGEVISYALRVSNAGPSTATGVRITEALPPGALATSLESSQGDCGFSDGVVACQLGELIPGGTVTVSIHVELSGVITGDVQLRASVTGNEGDHEPVNNQALGPLRIVTQSSPTLIPTTTPTEIPTPTVKPTDEPTNTPLPTSKPTSQPVPTQPPTVPLPGTAAPIPTREAAAAPEEESPSGGACGFGLGYVQPMAGMINLVMLLAPLAGIFALQRSR